MSDWLKEINMLLLWSLSLFCSAATQVLSLIKATFSNYIVWEVPFGHMISEQIAQVIAITGDHISARNGGKNFLCTCSTIIVLKKPIPASGFKFCFLPSLRL